ncbi:glycoside hydrolase family 55 protein [Crepidotus variabilis]|uniref:Glycoside hydrolase family 55 protein n=1 Tax=Crepidotus variabilis TaxID=179855 RepID=A0A9P6ELI1_9AGAR|nr:glycoside hydrolase family 55 protein [Crepidotus variabilis]
MSKSTENAQLDQPLDSDVGVGVSGSGTAPDPSSPTAGTFPQKSQQVEYFDADGNPEPPFWLESIKHQGKAPFHSPEEPGGYKVFRNVKDYGAVGDGFHDDTAAINLAISSQNRCGGGDCPSSTTSPALVYFPRGTYLISTPILPYYYTQLVGDAKHPPMLLASDKFDGMAVIDVNPYIPGKGPLAQWFVNTSNFHRSIRNFIIDIRRVPSNKQQGTGIHWQVAQATSLFNLTLEMSREAETGHQGIWMENGSGGVMTDLTFNGGKFGIWGGNQQFTLRNITVNNTHTAIYSLWNWGWTYQDIKFHDCQVGFEIATGGITLDNQTAGAQAIIDANIKNTPIFIRTSQPSSGSLAGSIVLNNVKLTNVPIVVGALDGSVVLAGTTPSSILPEGEPATTTMTIESWMQGNVYRGTNPQGTFVQQHTDPPHKSSALLDQQGNIVGRCHPQYEDIPLQDVVSARDHGAVGDGETDDTKALQDLVDKYASSKVIFLDAGFYVITSTLTLPIGTRLVGEVWSVIAGKGPAFQDQHNPQVVVRAGKRSDVGILEITDVVFATVGPTAGAIVLEWNVTEPAEMKAGCGMWDSHIRLAGSTGTNLEGTTCPKFGPGGYDQSYAGFLAMHITPSATGYFEGTWVWLADHDLDIKGEEQISAYCGRGILSESKGPVWMIGTASEHHVIYQYNLVNARDHYMGLIQTESPYFQPKPAMPTPFEIDSRYFDPPPYRGNAYSWALNIKDSKDIIVFGAGLYSFFVNYNQEANSRNCQSQILNLSGCSRVGIYSLSTVASNYQLSVEGTGIIQQSDNLNGFASTATAWTE